MGINGKIVKTRIDTTLTSPNQGKPERTTTHGAAVKKTYITTGEEVNKLQKVVRNKIEKVDVSPDTKEESTKKVPKVLKTNIQTGLLILDKEHKVVKTKIEQPPPGAEEEKTSRETSVPKVVKTKIVTNDGAEVVRISKGGHVIKTKIENVVKDEITELDGNIPSQKIVKTFISNGKVQKTAVEKPAESAIVKEDKGPKVVRTKI